MTLTRRLRCCVLALASASAFGVGLLVWDVPSADAAGMPEQMALQRLVGLEKTRDSVECIKEFEDEFFPNFGLLMPGMPGGQGTTASSLTLLEQASNLLLPAISAPVLTPVLSNEPNATSVLSLPQLYVCKEQPDAFLFGVTAGPGNATGKVMFEALIHFSVNQANVNLTLSRVNLTGPEITLDFVGDSFSFAAGDAFHKDFEAIVTLQDVPQEDNVKEFGAAFFLVRAQVWRHFGTFHDLFVRLLDVPATCGAADAAEIATAGNDDIPVFLQNVSVGNQSGFVRGEVSVCRVREFMFPSAFPTPSSFDDFRVYSLPVRDRMTGDTLWQGDAKLSLALGKIDIESKDLRASAGEEIIAPAPHATTSPVFYSARISASERTITPLPFTFAFVSCNNESSSPSLTTSISANASGWFQSLVVVNQSLCNGSTVLNVDLTGFINATFPLNQGLWIYAGHRSNEHDMGSPAMRADVWTANGTRLATFSSYAMWHAQKLAIPYSVLVESVLLTISLSLQEWYPLHEYHYVIQPPYPDAYIALEADILPPNASIPCRSVTANPKGTSQFHACGGGTLMIDVPGLAVTDPDNDAVTGYDESCVLQVLSVADGSRIADHTLSIEAIIPALVPLYNGTKQQRFRKQAAMELPSTGIMPIVPMTAFGSRLLVENPFGVPMRVSLSCMPVGCTPDGLLNDATTYQIRGPELMPPLLQDGKTGRMLGEPIVAHVCRGEADHFRLPLYDYDYIFVNLSFHSLASVVNSTDGSIAYWSDGLTLEVLASASNVIDGDTTIEGMTYRGRTHVLDASRLFPDGKRPTSVTLRIKSFSTTGEYTVSAQWRNKFTTVGGSKVLTDVILPFASSTSANSASADSTLLTGADASNVSFDDTALFFVLAGIVCVLLVFALALCVALIRRRGKPQLLPREPDSNLFELETFTAARILEGVQIELKIGEGNFGSVWKADWHGTPVAAKTVESVREIEGELAVLIKIDHPNCVHFLGVARAQEPGEVAERDFMIFELAEASVLSLLQGGGVSADRKLKMLRDCARGVNYLGGLGIVHRDLAARNLLYDRDRTLVSDFGLSRKYEGEFYATSAEGAKTSMPIRWTAPEILKQGKATIASDCYSFAVLIWEMFEDGNTPFAGLSNNEVMRIAGKGRVPTVLTRPADCPVELYTLMTRMWSHVPDDRPEFIEVLRLLESLCGSSNGPSRVCTPKTSAAYTALSIPASGLASTDSYGPLDTEASMAHPTGFAGKPRMNDRQTGALYGSMPSVGGNDDDDYGGLETAHNTLRRTGDKNNDVDDSAYGGILNSTGLDSYGAIGPTSDSYGTISSQSIANNNDQDDEYGDGRYGALKLPTGAGGSGAETSFTGDNEADESC